MNDLARRHFIQRRARFDNPIRQAIAAKSGQPHQLDILRIMALAQMADQPAKGGGGLCVIKIVERVGYIHIHGIRPWVCAPALP